MNQLSHFESVEFPLCSYAATTKSVPVSVKMEARLCEKSNVSVSCLLRRRLVENSKRDQIRRAAIETSGLPPRCNILCSQVHLYGAQHQHGLKTSLGCSQPQSVLIWFFLVFVLKLKLIKKSNKGCSSKSLPGTKIKNQNNS